MGTWQEAPWTGWQPITKHNCTYTHTLQFRSTDQPTTHVSGLVEETAEALGEHANFTDKAAAGFEPPTPELLLKLVEMLDRHHEPTVKMVIKTSAKFYIVT